MALEGLEREVTRVRSVVDRHRQYLDESEQRALYALVTNGLRWEAWELKPGSPRRENVAAEVNITTGDVGAVARSLQQLSYDALGA